MNKSADDDLIDALLGATDKPKSKPESINGLTIQPLGDVTGKLKVLLFGESGVGKTTLAGSVAEVEEMMPALLVDVEGGTRSIKGKFDSIDVVRAKSWNDVQKVYDYLFDNPNKYKTVILDSMSEIQKLALYDVMQFVVDKDASRDVDIPSLREYGKILEIMRKMVRAYRDLDMHVVITSLADTVKDDITGEVSTKPLFTGRFTNEVPAFMDFVLYMYTRQKGKGESIEITRHILTQKTEKVVAKDRSGKLPLVMNSPTFKELYSIVNK